MTFLTTLAQTYSTSTAPEIDAETAAASLAVTIGLLLFGLVIAVIAYVVSAIFLSKIFKKAGVEGWIAWVPFYNNWKLLEIGGQQGFWAILTLVPIANYVALVYMYIAMYHIGKKFGKQGTFVLLGIFLPLVWYIWLAVDKSTWNDAASTAPSLHHPTTPVAPTV